MAQAVHLAVQEVLSADSGFFSFARAATGRKYDVPARSLLGGQAPAAGPEEHRRLYEMTTGSTALTESLAMRRLLGSSPEARDQRTIDITSIKGIDIAEHPWEKMMAGKKPDPEPLARLTPYDHYYISFKSARALAKSGNLLDEWGGLALSAFEMTSQDSQIRQRYEKQLCLSVELAEVLGPDILKGVSVSGSDLYLREGSDVSLVFHLGNKVRFVAAAAPFIERARTAFGKGLREQQKIYRGVEIESFVTPRREVSLHRAFVGDFAIYSNSPAALRRILDTQAGRRKAMADALDFQYMRTIFVRSEKTEDGFAFLSDAFIRQLVGPASKIQEKRRLEALTSLRLLTHGALFTSWETGKVPGNYDELLRGSRLKAGEVYVPEGKTLAWDSGRAEAYSDVYNTMHFATPLLELPMDTVTQREAKDYGLFRDEYTRLWRRYFDPVGMRSALGKDGQVRLETYILPLIQSSQYNGLRELVGNGTTRFDLSAVSPRTGFQYLMHLAPRWRGASPRARSPLGDWIVLRWDDGPGYRQMVNLWIRKQMGQVDPGEDWREEARVFCQLPFAVGIKIGDQQAFNQALESLKGILGEVQRETVKYRGITLTRLRFGPDNQISLAMNDSKTPAKKRFEPELYHGQIDGVWYASFRVEVLREVIDRSLGRDGKEPDSKEVREVNTAVHIAPEALLTARDALNGYLEWETQRRARANLPLWEALYRGGVLTANAGREEMREAAMRWYGFVPVSPDGADYRYSRQREEVVNERHGSFTRPELHARPSEKSPLGQLLQQITSLQAELRFREDGVHTTLTIRRSH